MCPLQKRGFRPAGEWLADGRTGIQFTDTLSREPGVYAFTVNDRVTYAGAATVSLHGRVCNYRGAFSAKARTNGRVARLIGAALRRGARVQIWVCTPPDRKLHGFAYPMTLAVESGLIRDLAPIWNALGNASPGEAVKRARSEAARRAWDTMRSQRAA